MRLIDADEIHYTMLYKENWLKGTGVEDLAAWKKDIDNLPTIEERKKGKWVYTSTEPLGYVCSVCGKGCCCFDYCPNCGADMKGENDGK